MTLSHVTPPAVPQLPARRLALHRRAVLAATATMTPQRFPRPTSRRALAGAVALLALAVAGAALAVVKTDFLGAQARLDEKMWTPPREARIGGRVEVARGADWSYMAWAGKNATCVGYAAGASTNWVRTCGRAPGDTNTVAQGSKYLLLYGLAPNWQNGAADGRGAIYGAVTPDVSRVELERADGGARLIAETQHGPGLATNARFFIVRTALPDWRGFPITAITFYGDHGKALDREVLGSR